MMLSFLLGSRLRANIIGLLMTRQDERFYVRQLASLLNENSTNLSRELARLTDAGILARFVEGRRVFYQANARSPIFPELRGLAIKTAGLGDVLRNALSPLANRIRAAFVYGSFAEGRESSFSDIDLFIVGDPSTADVLKVLLPAQAKLGREINPVIYPPDEYIASSREKHHFVARVMSKGKIFLLGDLDELTRMEQESLADRP